MNTTFEPIFFVNSANGIYIPQIVAKRIAVMDNVYFDQQDVDLSELSDVENEFYWEEWMNLLESAEMTYEGQTYLLFQSEDGDVWWIHEDDQTSFAE